MTGSLPPEQDGEFPYWEVIFRQLPIEDPFELRDSKDHGPATMVGFTNADRCRSRKVSPGATLVSESCLPTCLPTPHPEQLADWLVWTEPGPARKSSMSSPGSPPN